MRRLLQAVFNEPIPRQTMEEIAALGFDGIRIDAQQVRAPAGMARLVEPALDAGLWPLVIVRDGEACAWLPKGTAIELRNEPDLEGPDPATYRDLLRGMRAAANVHGLELWGGVVSNLVTRGFRYLRTIAPDLPERVTIHWYPHRPWLQQAGHQGRSRQQELDLFRETVGDRIFGVSEFGFHTAPACSGFWWWRRCRALTDDEAAQRIRAEFAFWESAGAAFATLYQLNDGPDARQPLDRYGIRAFGGEWKPQAQAAQE